MSIFDIDDRITDLVSQALYAVAHLRGHDYLELEDLTTPQKEVYYREFYDNMKDALFLAHCAAKMLDYIPEEMRQDADFVVLYTYFLSHPFFEFEDGAIKPNGDVNAEDFFYNAARSVVSEFFGPEGVEAMPFQKTIHMFSDVDFLNLGEDVKLHVLMSDYLRNEFQAYDPIFSLADNLPPESIDPPNFVNAAKLVSKGLNEEALPLYKKLEKFKIPPFVLFDRQIYEPSTDNDVKNGMFKLSMSEMEILNKIPAKSFSDGSACVKGKLVYAWDDGDTKVSMDVAVHGESGEILAAPPEGFEKRYNLDMSDCIDIYAVVNDVRYNVRPNVEGSFDIKYFNDPYYLSKTSNKLHIKN